ncbi:MAG: fumarylacetoacetate hydrolase family protein [Pirellulales bacterium]|nr:fumarylacetoacetate hydrolase family protein [Pirellulales bacterium]
MRLVTYLDAQGEPRAAGVRGAELVDLANADPGLPSGLRALLAGGTSLLERAAAAIRTGPGLARSSVRLLPPIVDPQKIFGIGLNYADHARETGKEPPPEPVIFNKLPTALVAPGQPIVLPVASHKVDYEAELVAVIGQGGRDIPRERAYDHIAGYCCGNDVSARDWQTQKPGGQWLLGKSFDTFAPCGPELVTADEVGPPENLRVQCRLDGRTMQDSTTAQLIFNLPYLIEYLSRVVTLCPGDLIFTGTPPGVGVARQPPVYLQPGQTVEVEIEKLGVLTNPIIAAEGRV